jgi:hypothetical protein
MSPYEHKNCSIKIFDNIKKHPLSSFEKEKAIIEDVLVSNQFSTDEEKKEREKEKEKSRSPPLNGQFAHTLVNKLY